MLNEIIAFDNFFISAVQTLQSPSMDSIMQGITFIGNPVFWIIIAAIIYWLGRNDESFHLMNLILFSAAIVGALKIAVARERPDSKVYRVVATDIFSNFSFPSGHATLASAALFQFGRHVKRNAKLIFAFLIMGVAISRVYLGAHFLTDVIAGVLIGAFIGETNFIITEKMKHSKYKLSKLQDEAMVVVFIGAAAALALFAKEYPLVATLFGFYAGFFLCKEFEFDKKWAVEKGVHRNAIKLMWGFIGAGVIGFAIISVPSEMPFASLLGYALYFIAGLWISFIYPELYQKILKNARI